MISVNCLQCGKSFEAKRKTAKFCSDLCRVNFNNGKELKNETTELGLAIEQIQAYCTEISLPLNELISDHKKLRTENDRLKKEINEFILKPKERGEVKITDLNAAAKQGTNYSINTKKEEPLSDFRLNLRKTRTGY